MSSNFKYQLLNLSLLIGIVIYRADFAEALISISKSDTIKNHVAYLERVSNAHSQLLTQFQQQISDNQADIHFLRGQIQENQHQLNQIVERQKQILLRINSLDNISIKPTTKAQNINANMDYNIAINLVMQDKSHQDDAIIAFQNFIKNYPDSIYQPNANYWLGQLNYNKNRKDDAVFYFYSVIKNYPKSSKAPDAMYKIGIIMQEKGLIAKARTIYQQVINKYPNSDSAKQAQKRLSII